MSGPSGAGHGEDDGWTHRPARGYSWPPFESGNTAALQHGAYASMTVLGPRVDELADGLRPLVPGYRAADEVALRLLCVALARLERAEEAIAQREPGEAQKLRSDALGWANSARRLLNDLGMTPSSRASLGLDLARAEVATEMALDRLRERGAEAIERFPAELADAEEHDNDAH